MAEALKILGQSAPGAATDTALITVGSGKSHVISSLVICNTSSTTATTVRVHARVAGAAVAVSNAVVYEMPIGAYETITLQLGMTLAATDVLTVRTTLATVTFTAFGSEVS